MSVDSKMTAIADKIRGLLGLTGEMGLDAMATNLTTEQANITAALAALTEKGVEVPTGANSNALAGLIEAIEAGGFNYVTGSFTPSENTKNYTITHNLGYIPNFIIMWANELNIAAKDLEYYALSAIAINGSVSQISCSGYNKKIRSTIVETNCDLTTPYDYNCVPSSATTETATYNLSNWSVYMVGGQEYTWIAG